MGVRPGVTARLRIQIEPRTPKGADQLADSSASAGASSAATGASGSATASTTVSSAGAASGAGAFMGMGMGFGLRLGRAALDYSFKPAGELGHAQRLSLSTRF